MYWIITMVDYHQNNNKKGLNTELLVSRIARIHENDPNLIKFISPHSNTFGKLLLLFKLTFYTVDPILVLIQILITNTVIKIQSVADRQVLAGHEFLFLSR